MAASSYYSQIIRIAKRDSAWIYHVFEAQDGVVSYSTLPDTDQFEVPRLAPDGSGTCDLELVIPDGFLTQFQDLLAQLRQSGIWVYEIQPIRFEE